MSDLKPIKKELEFVAWLKEKGLYNEWASATRMQDMFEVWEKQCEQITMYQNTNIPDLLKQAAVAVDALERIADDPEPLLQYSVRTARAALQKIKELK